MHNFIWFCQVNLWKPFLFWQILARRFVHCYSGNKVPWTCSEWKEDGGCSVGFSTGSGDSWNRDQWWTGRGVPFPHEERPSRGWERPQPGDLQVGGVGCPWQAVWHDILSGYAERHPIPQGKSCSDRRMWHLWQHFVEPECHMSGSLDIASWCGSLLSLPHRMR